MTSYAQKKSRTKEVQDITGLSEADSKKLLEKHNWTVQAAVSDFFDNRDSFPGASSNASKGSAKLDSLFDKYKDPEDNQVMGEDGIMKFYKDIDVNPEAIEALVVAWQLKCADLGMISQNEFIQGYTMLNCSTLNDIKKNTKDVTNSLSNETTFVTFYKWLFELAREDEKHKSIPKEIAIALWTMVFKNKSNLALKNEWLEFANTHKTKELNAISRDLWEQLYDFLKETKSINTYDDSAAWPVAIDEFVEYMQEKK